MKQKKKCEYPHNFSLLSKILISVPAAPILYCRKREDPKIEIQFKQDLLAYNLICTPLKKKQIKNQSVVQCYFRNENLFLFDWLNGKVSRKGLSVECMQCKSSFCFRKKGRKEQQNRFEVVSFPLFFFFLQLSITESYQPSATQLNFQLIQKQIFFL